jgi:copper chaperone
METKIHIQGMHCDGCASRVKRVLEKEPGVRNAEVSYETGEARVKYDDQAVSVSRFRELIERAGYAAGEGT